MEFIETEDKYSRHCNFKGFLAEELDRRYSPNPWVFQSAVEYSAIEQHFAVNFRNFDGSRHLTVAVKRINGVFHYTFSEK